MTVYHMQGGKPVKLAQPQQFLAQERTIVEEAYPGDIIGIFDPGIFGIGDSLSDEKLKFSLKISRFSRRKFLPACSLRIP